MSFSSALFATSTLALALVTQAQEPTFDVQVAVPTAAAAVGSATSNLDPQSTDGRTSIEFLNASITDVLNFLKDKGFNYVVQDMDVPASKTVTLSIKDRPLKEIADAVATSLGGHWINRNGVHIFSKDAYDSFKTVNPEETIKTAQSLIQSLKSSPDLKLPQSPSYTLPKATQPWTVYAFPNVEFGGKNWQYQPKEFSAPGKGWTWESKQFGDFDQATEEFRKKMQGSDEFKQKWSYEFQFYASPLPKAIHPAPRVFVNQAPYLYVHPTPRGFAFPHSRYGIPSQNLKVHTTSTSDRLFSSLTPHQKALQSQRGYLHYSELSPAQQRILTNPNGQFVIEYRSGAKRLVIKN